MKTWHILLVIFAVMAARAYAQQDSIPSDVVKKLQSREESLHNREIDWHLKQVTVQSSADQATIAKIKQQIPDQVRRDLRKDHGITDPKIAQKYIDSRVASIIEAESAYKVEASSLWRWTNDGVTTAVSGAVQDSPSLRTGFTYYFGGDWGIYVNTESFDPKTGKKTPLDEPAAWENSDGVLSSPVPNAPYLKPADGVFLFGRNPLNAYKATWRVVSRTPSAIILNAEVVGKSSHPLKLRLILDPLHGMAPSQLDIVRGRHESTYRVVEFGTDKDVWLPKQVKFSSSLGDGLFSSSEWRFVESKPATPISVNILKGTDVVTDYRLLDGNMSPLSMLDEKQRPDSKVVAYRWTGGLPTRQKLQEMQRLYHPGESTPDPGKTSSAMLLIGGLFCLVGGVWMFKRRGLS